MRVSTDASRPAGTVVALLLAVLLAAPVAAATPAKSDVRVLIDISGSMRQNDPDNLRRPALRMLAGLLQPGTRAGVWTFARWVNNLVPVAEVDAAWKKRTQSLSGQIKSPGQFTNIEEVLDKASGDWDGKPVTHQRHLVLLTDGMVDISKDARDNAQSRARILEDLLPRLKAAGVKVHTIALSARADHALMERLAAETGGWYQQVARADELQRVFLRMFEKVGSPDAIPLADNRFTVDSSIKEATVLVFSRPDSPPVVLHSPGGQEFRDSDLPAGVAWYRDRGYDLITIASPQKGEWRLQADVDPDNRVMIVTDLKLQTSEVPTHIAAGEETGIEANLSNRGKLVTRKAFLRLLEVSAEAVDADGGTVLAINDRGEGADQAAADGRYSLYFGRPEAQPEVELLVAVDSPTFMREKRFRLIVHEPVEAAFDDAAAGPLLQIRTEPAVMQPDASVVVWQVDADGQRQTLAVEQIESGMWHAALADPSRPAHVQVSGTSRLGNLIERELGPLIPPGVEPPAATAVPEPAVEQLAPQVAPTPEPEPVPGPPPAETIVAEPVADPPAADDAVEENAGWVLPVILFGAFNLLLAAGGGVWFYLQRRRGGDDDGLALDELVGQEPVTADADAQAETREEAA